MADIEFTAISVVILFGYGHYGTRKSLVYTRPVQWLIVHALETFLNGTSFIA